MPIRIQDLLDEGAVMTLWCPRCRRRHVFRPEHGLRRLSPDQVLRDLQERTRCAGCRQPGEVWVALPDGRIHAVRAAWLSSYNNDPFLMEDGEG
jgi:hypothetical protein